MSNRREKTASELLQLLRGHYKQAEEDKERSFLGNVALRAGQGAGIGAGLGFIGGAGYRVPMKGLPAVRGFTREQIRKNWQLRQILGLTALGAPAGLLGGALAGAGENVLQRLRKRDAESK